jgi:membrane dipeptidase
MTRGHCDVGTVADHVEHALRIAGPEHVGYGSDFDGTDRVPVGLESVDRLPSLTAELLARGHDHDDLGRILGGNYLRVFESVLGRSAPAPS